MTTRATYYRDRHQNKKGQAKFKTHISFSNRYALWIHSTHPDFGTKLSKFQNYPTQPQINQKFQNSTQVYIYISPTPKIILQALKQTITPPHQFSHHPPPTQMRTQYKRLKSGNSVRNHH